MTDLLFGCDQDVGKWVAGQLGYCGFAGNFMAAIGTTAGGALIGGVVFHNFYPQQGVIEMSAAGVSARWLSRAMIRAMFTYAFDFLGCQLVILRVSEHNTRMIDIANRFGFFGYFVRRLRGRNEGEWLFTYTNDDWRLSRYRKRAD